jgi:hypothetical protein
MTKKQLIEKWTAERKAAADEAFKLNINLGLQRGKAQRLKHAHPAALQKANTAVQNTKAALSQLSARVVTIDEFLKDI